MHGASHEVLGRLAVGGMAELYLARTTYADGRREIVVLKRILPHLAEDPDFVRMFRDEAYLAATLDHPNIVRVHDLGQDGEDYFFTMEYVHGENVRTLIKAAQKLDAEIPLVHVIQIALGVCEGLHYAHEQVDEEGKPLRIVHRDVSPTNILVSFDGEVKIVDFGIAKAAAATHVTQAGMLKGKASYMSPEQCRAELVDRRSDVFAIGILVYEMTTLTRLFRGDNELAVLHQILTGTVEPPSTRVEGYPADLERLVMRALAQRPDDRYPTALAMHDDLVALARARGLHPSREALGEFLRELCGERPLPWVDDEDEEHGDEPLGADQTGMPTSMGHFEDEEDTQVNRRAPELRTLVPGAPTGWTAEGEPEDAETTGTTSRRQTPAGLPSAAPRGPALRVGEPAPALPRTGPARDAGGRLRLPGKGVPRRPVPSTEATVPAPGVEDDPPPEGDDGPVTSEATTPMAKPGAARSPLPRGPVARGARADAPAPIRSGRTLAGAGGGLAGPLPARSGRTLPGAGPSGEGEGPVPAQTQMVAGQSPLPGSADRTLTAGAGSRPLPSRPVRPGLRAPGTPEGEPAPSPAAAERPAAPTPEPTAPVPPASQWTGPGVDRTQLAPPLPPRGDVDEGARTLAMPRFDRASMTQDRPLPRGPTAWEDPMTRTQKTTPSDPNPALTSTQRAPVQSLTVTQRSPSAAYPPVPVPIRTEHAGGDLADLRRPEMRSPSPRPPSTPRSLWVPVLIVVIVALASTAAWLWMSSGR